MIVRKSCCSCGKKITFRKDAHLICGMCAQDYDAKGYELKNDPKLYIGATLYRGQAQRLEDMERWEKHP